MSITRIFVILVLLLFATLSIIISGCYKHESPFEAAPLSTSLPTSSTLTTLTWDVPTKYADGTDLAETDIREYRVYFGTSSQVYSSFYSVGDPNSSVPPTCANVNDIISQATGTFYFAVTALDKNGNESDFSNEVIRQIN